MNLMEEPACEPFLGGTTGSRRCHLILIGHWQV